MFNAFSKAFLDKKNIGKNASNNTSNVLSLKNPSAAFMSKGISENAGTKEKGKFLSLKERLASVRNVQNIIAKKKTETEDVTNTDTTNNVENNAKDKHINELKKPTGNELLLPKFKNYNAVMNEKNNEKQQEEETEKKLKKRKRRKKHEILMERMKQQGKGKYDQNEENQNEEDEEEETHNDAFAEGSMKRRRPGRPSKQKQEEKQQEEKEEEEEEEEEEDEEGERLQNRMSKNDNNFRNSLNSGNNRNSAVSNNDGEPVKQRRKRRKKKEMEALRAQGLVGKGLNNQNNSKTNVMNTTGQEENKTKRRRGRPKLSGNTQNNIANDKSKNNDNMKGMDIRRYCSKNDDDNSTGTNGNIMRKMSSNNMVRENDKRNDHPIERGGDRPRNIFKIITSAKENDGFMKKTPNEIEQLERSYKNNVKSGVTCIPLNYQENGGGMSIIFINTDTEYGPIKNSNGFMTFLVLECDSEQFFIETGITHNVIECEKHMQLLISPGDTYTFKNNSHELEAKLLLIACNKMTEPLDLKNHIRDPTMNQEKG